MHILFSKITKTCIFPKIFKRNFQVTVVGAAGNIGQSLSMLLRQNPLITRLFLYDIQPQTAGVAADLSHIPREAQVDAWTCCQNMEYALKCADIVVITQGVPRRPATKDNDIFYANADGLIYTMHKIVECCPNAFIAMITDPVNYTVPLASRVLECLNAYDKRKLFGLTALDTIRAQSFIGSFFAFANPQSVYVPVICGQSEQTIVPLFSNVIPNFVIDNTTARTMTTLVRCAESQVVREKKGAGASRLAVAHAAYDFISGLLTALSGTPVVQTAFVANNDYGTKFFACPVVIDCNGITEVHRFKGVTNLENILISCSSAHLVNDILAGESYYKPPIKGY